MAALTREYCRELIIRDYCKWKDRELPDAPRPKAFEVLPFYGYLQKDHPQLLSFSYGGDKWQKVKNWLATAGYIDAN